MSFVDWDRFMLNKEQKKTVVKDLVQELKSAKALVLSDFQGLPTRDIQKLRADLRREKVSYKVVKLTLLKKALRQAGVDVSQFNFAAPLSVSLSAEDEVIGAKILAAFAKTHDKLKIVGGYLGAEFLDATRVKAMAALPGKQELRGQLVYVIASPLRGLVSVLQGNMRGLVNVLNAIGQSK